MRLAFIYQIQDVLIMVNEYIKKLTNNKVINDHSNIRILSD